MHMRYFAEDRERYISNENSRKVSKVSYGSNDADCTDDGDTLCGITMGDCAAHKSGAGVAGTVWSAFGGVFARDERRGYLL